MNGKNIRSTSDLIFYFAEHPVVAGPTQIRLYVWSNAGTGIREKVKGSRASVGFVGGQPVLIRSFIPVFPPLPLHYEDPS